MKLKGSSLLDIKLQMTRAKEAGKEDSPIQIYLDIKPGENPEELQSKLEKNYQAKPLEYFGFIDTLVVEVPVKNLRKVVEEKFVERYEWPGIVEVLTNESKPETKEDLITRRGHTTLDT